MDINSFVRYLEDIYWIAVDMYWRHIISVIPIKHLLGIQDIQLIFTRGSPHVVTGGTSFSFQNLNDNEKCLKIKLSATCNIIYALIQDSRISGFGFWKQSFSY